MRADHIDSLIKEYIRRRNFNPSYSERAFARALGLSPGYLKLLLQKKRRISVTRAQEVSERLGWSLQAKRRFIAQVRLASPRQKKLLGNKKTLTEEVFSEISDWYHFALIELLKLSSRPRSVSQLAQELNISKLECDFALSNLERQGVVIRNQSGGCTLPARYEIPSMSSQNIRKYHRQVGELSLKALDEQDFETRDFRALTLAFDRNRMEEATTTIQKFVAEFDRKFGSVSANSVYQLNVSYFKLNKENT